MASPAPGNRVGPYELLAPVGSGGMGEVWKARDTRLDRIVAIKFSAARFSDRFEREARAAAALNHSNICTLYDVGPDYLVMEFVDGQPLKAPLPVATAIRYAGQILDALEAAHRKGIIHRDLKPANILVTKSGIKLLDFELAKHGRPLEQTESTLTGALTGEGEIVGTLQYMSPEQLQSRDADARSDMFSFGCVLYEMLTGKAPFAGSSAASVIAAIIEREPAPIDGPRAARTGRENLPGEGPRSEVPGRAGRQTRPGMGIAGTGARARPSNQASRCRLVRGNRRSARNRRDSHVVREARTGPGDRP
jgi:serine/threonine protein kinase